MPKSTKKNKRTKYNISLEEFEKSKTGSKSDELKNTNNINVKKDMKKNQFEDETECNKPLKEGRKHTDSNNEHVAEHSDSMICDGQKIVLDHQNEHFTNKICGEAESSFKNNKNYEINHGESKNKSNEKNDTRPELLDKMDEKVEKESNKIGRSKKKKNKSSDRHHKDSLNCNNKTENDNDTPNISSTDKRRSRSRQGHNKPHHKEKSCSRSRNRDSSNNNCTSNKTEKRNKITNACEDMSYHRDSEFEYNDANNEPGPKHRDFSSDKKKTSLDRQKNKNRVEEMEHNPSGTTRESYGRNQTWSKNNLNESSDKYLYKSNQHNKSRHSNSKFHHQMNRSDRYSTNNEYTGDAECTLNQIDEDLFKLPDEFPLAHCVAEDLRMGAGIAVEFKRIFGGVGKLFDQNLKVGDVGIINRKNRTVFYLVTKKMSSGKPTMKSLEKTLYTLLDKMKELNLTKLGIPQIGCGLDNLDWSEVSLLIKEIFSGSNIQITVCVPSKIESKKPWPLKVYLTSINLWDMMSETVFIIFIDLGDKHQNNLTNNVVEEINKKYPFKENLLKDIKNKKYNPGDITEYRVNNEVILCAFTNQNKYFTSIEEAFLQINRKIKTKYTYLAIQSGPMEDYIERIVLIYRSTVKNSELWLCGHPGQGQQLAYEQYCSSMRLNSLNSLNINN